MYAFTPLPTHGQDVTQIRCLKIIHFLQDRVQKNPNKWMRLLPPQHTGRMWHKVNF